MVKIGALIGAFFTTIGGFFFINALSSILGKNLSWEVIADAASFTSDTTSPLGVISIFLFYLGIIVVLGSGFIKGTLFLKIGGGVMALGILSILAGWFIGGTFEGPYNIGGIILFLGIILYFIGCIQFRKHNIVTIFTSLLLVLSILGSQIVIGLILMLISGGSDTMKEAQFISLISQVILFILHSWVFGFSKKHVRYSDKVEDTLSVEKGQAFASYVPDEMKKKKKKGKKEPESDEITFTF